MGVTANSVFAVTRYFVRAAFLRGGAELVLDNSGVNFSSAVTAPAADRFHGPTTASFAHVPPQLPNRTHDRINCT